MSAKLEQLILASFQGLVDIEPGDAACRTLCNPVHGCHHNSGAVIFFYHPRSDDSNDSGMPLFLMKDDRTFVFNVKKFFDELLGMDEDILIDFAPVDILCFQHAGKIHSRCVIVGDKQFNRSLRIAKSADRINSGSQDEYDLTRRHRVGLQSGAVEKSFDARPWMRCNNFKSQFDENAVLVDQWNDIGSGCECDEVEILSDR